MPRCCLLLFVCACLCAQSKTTARIPCAELPPAVKAATVKQKLPALAQAACEKIQERGETFYEVKVTPAPGQMREIVYRPDGEISEWEEESQLAAVPKAAQAAILKAVAGGELAKVDIIHRGRTVLYEGEYRVNGAKKKVIVDAAGHPAAD